MKNYEMQGKDVQHINLNHQTINASIGRSKYIARIGRKKIGIIISKNAINQFVEVFSLETNSKYIAKQHDTFTLKASATITRGIIEDAKNIAIAQQIRSKYANILD